MAELIHIGEGDTLRKLKARARVHFEALNARLFSEISGQPMTEVCAMYAGLVKLTMAATIALAKQCGVPTKAINELIQSGKL